MHVSKRVLAFILVGALIVLPLVAQTDTTKDAQTPGHGYGMGRGLGMGPGGGMGRGAGMGWRHQAQNENTASSACGQTSTTCSTKPTEVSSSSLPGCRPAQSSSCNQSGVGRNQKTRGCSQRKGNNGQGCSSAGSVKQNAGCRQHQGRRGSQGCNRSQQGCRHQQGQAQMSRPGHGCQSPKAMGYSQGNGRGRQGGQYGCGSAVSP